MGRGEIRIASILAGEGDPAPEMCAQPLGLALLSVSPRVSLVRSGICRLDARGWRRLGGETELAETIRAVAHEAGFPAVRVGIADTGVAADAAARLTVSGCLTVPPRGSRAFLSPLPPSYLPISEDLRAMLRALGFRRIGQIARRERSEWESRLGPEGVRIHRWACGEDDGSHPYLTAKQPPEASFELEAPARVLEPLLFVLRHLLARVCSDLMTFGKSAAGLTLECGVEDGSHRRVSISPARPTAREDLLFELGRAALEREFGNNGPGTPAASVTSLTLRVDHEVKAGVRQGDLFARRWRDPLSTAVALARIRARLGEAAVVHPARRAGHRPEARNAWTPVAARESREDPGWKEDGARAAGAAGIDPPESSGEAGGALRPVLRLLPSPMAVRIRSLANRPCVLWDEGGRQEVTAAEGPERLSGDWWGNPYRREYYRLCTERGELLWVFREPAGDGEYRWWLHGWWD
ncbi:MAG: hypothetical protein ACE5HQ_00985 [Gemmatimonadota bacterium]